MNFSGRVTVFRQTSATGLSRSRDVSRKIHFAVLRAPVADCMPAENHEKKGRIDRPRRVHYALLYARALYAILFVVSRRLGASLFLAFSPSLGTFHLALALARPLSVCHFHPDDRREMESYWMKQREKVKPGRVERGGAKGWDGDHEKRQRIIFIDSTAEHMHLEYALDEHVRKHARTPGVC